MNPTITVYGGQQPCVQPYVQSYGQPYSQPYVQPVTTALVPYPSITAPAPITAVVSNPVQPVVAVCPPPPVAVYHPPPPPAFATYSPPPPPAVAAVTVSPPQPPPYQPEPPKQQPTRLGGLGVILKKEAMVKSPRIKDFQMPNGDCKNRWFLLTTNALRYCTISRKGDVGKVKRDIPLSSIMIVEPLDIEVLNTPYVFQVIHRDCSETAPVLLYVHASNEEQQQAWIQAIKRACRDANVKLSPTYHPGTWQKQPGIWQTGSFSCCGSSKKTDQGCAATTPIK